MLGTTDDIRLNLPVSTCAEHAVAKLGGSLDLPPSRHWTIKTNESQEQKKVPMRADPACGTRRACSWAVKGRSICAKKTLRALPGSGGHSGREAVLPARRKERARRKKRVAHVSRCRSFVAWNVQKKASVWWKYTSVADISHGQHIHFLLLESCPVSLGRVFPFGWARASCASKSTDVHEKSAADGCTTSPDHGGTDETAIFP